MSNPFFYLATIVGILVVILIIAIAFRLLKVKGRRSMLLIVGIVSIFTFIINLIGIVDGVGDISDKSISFQFFAYLTAVLKSIIYSIMVFTLKDQFNSFGAGIKANIYFSTVYYIIVVVGTLVWAFAILTLLSVGLVSRMRILFSRAKSIHIFSEINEKSRILAEDIVKSDPKSLIIFISPKLKKGDLAKSISKDLIQKGYAVVTLATGNDFFERLGLPKRHLKQDIKVYCLSESDADNFKFANENFDSFGYKKKSTLSKEQAEYDEKYCLAKNLKVYIKSENRPDVSIECRHNNYLLYESFLTATSLVKKYPLHRAINQDEIVNGAVKRKLRLGIVGLGRTGEEVFKKLYADGQNVGLNIETVIFDAEINEKSGIFFHRYPYLANLVKPKTVTGSITEGVFFDNILEKDNYIDYFVLCLGNDSLSIEIANRIKREYEMIDRSTIIAVHIREAKNELLLAKSEGGITMVPFGNYKEIYSKDTIINDKYNRIAKIINYVYGRFYNEIFGECKERFDHTIDEKDYESEYNYKSDKYTALFNEVENISFDSLKADAIEECRKHLNNEPLAQKAKARLELLKAAEKESCPDPKEFEERKAFAEKEFAANPNDKTSEQLKKINEEEKRGWFDALRFLSDEKWLDADAFSRKSSLASAEHFVHKLYFCQAKTKEEALEKLSSNRVLVKNLAESEHMRWNAFHVMNGWRPLDYVALKSQPEYEKLVNSKKHSMRKNTKKQLHACLVGWDELKEVNKVFRQNYYVYDYLYDNVLELLLRNTDLFDNLFSNKNN